MAMNQLQLNELHDLEELLDADEMLFLTGELSEELKQRFKVTDLRGATWVMGKLRSIEAKKRDILAVAEAERFKINEWEQKELRKLDDDFHRLAFFLEEYHRELIQQDPKAKTITTPYGKMQIRKSQPKWLYDEDAVLAWLKNHKMTEFVRVKEEVNKADLKKFAHVVVPYEAAPGQTILAPITPDGEVIEGIVVEEQPDTFKVEVAE